MRSRLPAFASFALALSIAGSAAALDADPSNYQSVVATLKAGDTLNLAAGTYTGGLNITDLQGTPDMPIVIQGAGETTVFEGNGCCNTVEIKNSSHVAIRKIKVDGKGIDGVFGVSAKDGVNNVVHHITVEDCTFVGQNGSQQTVAISTKTPTFGWIIRRNVIDGAGTGMYLGNSDHSQPFVGGLIEYNLIKNTIGYNMQIKDQDVWPVHPALPDVPARTILRHNVFIKDDQPSPDGARPNVFLGGLPPSGNGADDRVEVYGNLFYHNSSGEGLIQAAGRVSIHDNLFVDASDEAISLVQHDGFPLLRAGVYNNTIYGASRGIVFGSAGTAGDEVIGNLIFAASPIEGDPAHQDQNITDAVAAAASYVTAPSTVLGQMDFHPLAGAAEGPALDLMVFSDDAAPGCDFDGVSKGGFTFRGAYAGSGPTPGWMPAAAIKPEVASCGQGGSGGSGGGGGASGGSGGATGGSGGGSGGSGATGGSGSDSEDGGGCGCRTAVGLGDGGIDWRVALVAASVACVWRRRRVGVRASCKSFSIPRR